MIKKAQLILFVISFMLLPASPVAAQTPTPPTPAAQRVVLSGKIVNRSPGGSVPEKLDLMLHAWDQSSTEKLMLDGQSNPDGTFQFKDVPVEAGLLYGVMAMYDGISYISEPVLAGGQPLTQFEVAIYDTTTDASRVQIDQRYVMFVYTGTGLQVTEVYFVSNRGDRTVQDAVQLADGKVATLQFPLPAEAINLGYDPATKDQFLRTPEGFAFTGPLPAGGQPGRIILRYVIPYRSGMTYTVQAPYATQRVNLLVESDSGLTVAGEGLTDGGVQKIDETRSATVMQHRPLSRGETAQVILTGQPKVSSAGQPVSSLPAQNPLWTPQVFLGLAGIVLAVGLGVFGWWWFHQPEPALAVVEGSEEAIDADPLGPATDRLEASTDDTRHD